MARPKQQLEQELLALSEQERAELVIKLISSLDPGAPNADADALWLQEATQRAAAVREGTAETYLASDVIAAIKNKF